MEPSVKKILVIRFSAMGDIILTTPIIRCLKNQGEDVHITYLTYHKNSEILKFNPYIDRIWSVSRIDRSTLLQIRFEKYDLIVDLHKNFKSFAIKLIANSPKVLSFDKLNALKWLFVRFKLDYLPAKHLVDRYFDSLHQIGIKDDGHGLDFFMPPAIPQLELPKKYAVLVLGATHFTKRIPPSLIDDIIAHYPLEILLLGGKDVAELGATTKDKWLNKVQNYCGKWSLWESAQAIKNAHEVITSDTGMMHIAAAFQKKIHVIWGNTTPKLGMYPYFGSKGGKAIHHEVSGLPCRPCSKIGFAKCPKQHFKCMIEQKVDFSGTSIEL